MGDPIMPKPFGLIVMFRQMVDFQSSPLQSFLSLAKLLASGLPVLRVVGVGLNLKFLHRVHRRDVSDVVSARLCVVRHAINEEFMRLRSSSDAPLRNGPLSNGR